MANLTLEQLQKVLDKGFKDQDARFSKKLETIDKRFDTIDKQFETQNGTTQKMLDGFARDIKAFIKNQDDELGRMTNKGFEDVLRRLDFKT